MSLFGNASQLSRPHLSPPGFLQLQRVAWPAAASPSGFGSGAAGLSSPSSRSAACDRIETSFSAGSGGGQLQGPRARQPFLSLGG